MKCHIPKITSSKWASLWPVCHLYKYLCHLAAVHHAPPWLTLISLYELEVMPYWGFPCQPGSVDVSVIKLYTVLRDAFIINRAHNSVQCLQSCSSLTPGENSHAPPSLRCHCQQTKHSRVSLNPEPLSCDCFPFFYLLPVLIGLCRWAVPLIKGPEIAFTKLGDYW